MNSRLFTVCLGVLLAMVGACGPEPECCAPPPGHEAELNEDGCWPYCEGEPVEPQPFTPIPGTYDVRGTLVSQTIDNPTGALGCVPPEANLIFPQFTFPLSADSGCAVVAGHDAIDDYQIVCTVTGSGGHYTPEPNPTESRTFLLNWEPDPVQLGGACSCYYWMATGTMTDVDNWRDCRSHTWNVRALQVFRCPVTQPDGSCTFP